MDFSFLSSINYIAVVVSSLIFFFVGWLWYSVLFGTMWAKELKRHNVVIKEPSSDVIMKKMILTFSANLLASFAMAELAILTGSCCAQTGLILGSIAALGIAVPALGSVFIWESRSLKLFLIDVGYPAIGIIIAAIIVSVWQ